MRLISWNVNGLRSVYRKGFLDWLYADTPDVLLLQEVKADPEDLPDELKSPKEYRAYFHNARSKKGYSGVAALCRDVPLDIQYGLGIPEIDREGRAIFLTFERFTLINAYFPNSERGPERLHMKLDFNDAILKKMEKLRRNGTPIVLCGDLNAAHEDIDLARPRENDNHAGFLAEERAWVDELVAAGFIDTFRYFYPTRTGAYTYWNQITRARDRNVGWRIDYFFISPELLRFLKSAFILDYVHGSDHAPCGIELLW